MTLLAPSVREHGIRNASSLDFPLSALPVSPLVELQAIPKNRDCPLHSAIAFVGGRA
jgi:hypothetical protein